MKNKFQSKTYPQGSRTLWRYLSALIILFTFAIGNVWAEDVTWEGPYGNFVSKKLSDNKTEITITKSISNSSKTISCIKSSSQAYLSINGNGKYLKFIAPTGYTITNIQMVWMSGAANQALPILFGEEISAIGTVETKDNAVTITNGGFKMTSVIATNGGNNCDSPDNIALPTGTKEVMIGRSGAYNNTDYATIGNVAATVKFRLAGSSGYFNQGVGTGSTPFIGRVVLTVVPEGYSVTYVENGHGANQTDLTGQTKLPATLPTLSETGWIFGGWFTDNGTFETPAVAGATLTANATLYAKWTEDSSVTKYEVTYNLNGASGDAPTQEDVAEGVSFNLAAAPSWAGHAFDGWLCSADAAVKAAGSSYTMTAANTTFTAQWHELECKIYSFTGGIGSATAQTANATVDAEKMYVKDSGDKIRLTPASGETFKVGDIITFSGNLNNLSKKFGLKLYANGGSSVSQTIENAVGTVPMICSAALTFNADYIDFARADGTGTTVYTCEVHRSCAEGAAAGLSYAVAAVDKTEGDAAFTNALTNANGLVVAGYSSSNTAVATVASNGQVTIVAPGSATITANSAVQTKAGTLYAAGTASYTLTVAACTAPRTPEFATTDPVVVTKNSATATWDVLGGHESVAKYQVSVVKISDASVVLDWTDCVYATPCTYTATGLEPETAYTFKLRSVGADGYCALSDVVTEDFTTLADLADKYTVIFKDGTTELATQQFEVGTYPSDAGVSKTKPLYTFAAWQKDAADIALDAAFWTTVAKDAEVTLTARWAKAYATSYDMEAYAASDGASKEGLEAALTAANYAYTNINGIDNGHTHNYTYDGMKYKTNDGDLSFNVVAGKVVEVKTGHLPSNDAVTMYINGVANATVFEGADESQETHKTNYFYSAVEALYRLDVLASKGTCSVKKITIRDPYTVSFEAHGDADPSALQGLPSVTLPDASNGTASLLGWFDAETGGNKIGDAGDTYIPTANITLHAQWEAISTDHTLSDLKVGGVTVDGFDPAVNTYYVVLPYGTAVGDIPAISATANSPKAKQVAIQQAVWTDEPYNCYRAQANVQAEDESWGYYDVRFSFAPKDGVSIIKVATTGGTNKTVTGAYAGDGDVNLSSNTKMDDGKYIGFILEGTTLQAGDKINVHTTEAANTGGSHIIFYDNMTDKNELYETGEIGGVGDNIFTINAAMVGATTAYVYRSNADNAHKWNGKVNYIEVTRAMDPVLTAITIDTRDGVIDPLDDKHFSVTIPYESDLAALIVVPTVIRNAAHATTPEAVISNEGAWIEGANTYRVMDKDGDYTDYTITLTRDVLKHTVSYNTHGGSAVASEEVEHNAYLAAAPAAPTKEDYIFQYWSLSDGGAEVDVTTVQIDEDKTFHAIWASDGAIKLLDGSTVNHTNFITAVTADETVEFKGNTVNYAKFSGTVSGVNGVKDLTRVIAYNATTNKTKIQISAHNNSTSGRNILVKGLVEGADAATDLATIALGNKEDKISDWIEFDNAANRTIYIFVPSSAGDVYFTQVKVIESGETQLKMAGEAGYSLNFNKGRFFGVKDLTAHFEGLDVAVASSDCAPLNTEVVKLASTSISFVVASPVTLTVTTNNDKTYYVTKGSAGTDNETAKAGASDFNLTAGTWYITGGASNVEITNIAFALPKCEKPVFNALQNSDLCAGDPYVALDGTGTVTDGGSITYKWYAEGGTDVLGTNATYTPSADGNYYVVALHHVDGFTDNEATSDVVSVTHYASAAITTAPEDQRVDVGSNATLSVVASGKAPLTYQWYTCDDALGTNPVIIAGAESDTYVVAVTAGLNQYYKVVVSSGCGEASAVALVEEWTELPQLDVTESMTWDWTYAGENNKLVAGKNVEVVMANIKENGKQPTNDATFRSQALLFYGENVRATEGGRNYASIGHISFNTTVPGIVKVEFSDNGSNDRRLKINDYMSESSSSKTDVKTFAAYVNAGNVTLMGVDEDGSGTNKYIRISKIIFTANPTPDYTRNVTNNIGTLCVDHNVLAGGAVGATFYQIASRSEQYNDKIDFEEVLPGEELKAGEPYIFQSTTGRIDLFYGATVADDPVAVRGMHGVLADGSSLTITEENKMDVYYIQDNKLRDCSNLSSLTLVKNRAYIVMSEVPTFAEYQAAQTSNPAPRRRVTLGRDAEQVATGCENLNVSDKPVKMIIDGQLFILRGEKMFDATGRLVK